jgi:hypothetical protein
MVLGLVERKVQLTASYQGKPCRNRTNIWLLPYHSIQIEAFPRGRKPKTCCLHGTSVPVVDIFGPYHVCTPALPPIDWLNKWMNEWK